MDESLQFILFAVVAGGLLLGVGAGSWLPGPRRRLRRSPPPRPGGPPHLRLVPPSPPQVAALAPEAAEQLRQVTAAPFRTRPLLSGPEARILRAAEAAIAERGLSWRVMARVGLGEILASPNARAYAAITSKRVDLLLIDATGQPLAAIECRGAAPVRDAVKQAALRRAGVRWIDAAAAEHRPHDLGREIDRLAAALGVARPRRPPEAPAAPAKE